MLLKFELFLCNKCSITQLKGGIGAFSYGRLKNYRKSKERFYDFFLTEKKLWNFCFELLVYLLNKSFINGFIILYPETLSASYPAMSNKSEKSEIALETSNLDAHSQRIIEVRTIMREREDARKSNNFGKSDRLRDLLSEKYGVEVKDQVGGPSGWKFKDGSTRKLMPGTTVPEQAVKKRDREEELPESGKKQKTNGRDHSRASDDLKASKKADKDGKLPSKTSDNSDKSSKKNDGKGAPSPELQKNKQVLESVMGGSSSKGVQNIQGILIEDITVGSGKVAESGKKCKMGYVGRLKSNGKIFDASGNKPFSFRLGRSEVIRGWDIGVAGMKVGGKRRLTIPPEKAYGRQGAPPTIPGNATLVFEVTLMEVN